MLANKLLCSHNAMPVAISAMSENQRKFFQPHQRTYVGRITASNAL